MKKVFITVTAGCIILAGCQKALSDSSSDDGTQPGTDSLIVTGDTLTYEIITADTAGWFGMWNEPGKIASNPLDSVTFGSPVYFASGWRKSFVCPSTAFQAFISAACKGYNQDITANLYQNSKLIKSVTNDAMNGVAKFLVTADTDTLTGTASNPVLTYEVLVHDSDANKFEADAWTGQWNMPDGTVSDLHNPLLDLFAIPGGWRYSFKPDHLPFTMYLAASPYTAGAATVTVNFYVNGSLVKTVSSQTFTYGNTFVVQ